jgi:hypothetical protein
VSWIRRPPSKPGKTLSGKTGQVKYKIIKRPRNFIGGAPEEGLTNIFAGIFQIGG